MTTAQQCFYVSLDPAVVSSGQFMRQASGTYSTATLRSSLGVHASRELCLGSG